jgi:hypothetical protein
VTSAWVVSLGAIPSLPPTTAWLSVHAEIVQGPTMTALRTKNESFMGFGSKKGATRDDTLRSEHAYASAAASNTFKAM